MLNSARLKEIMTAQSKAGVGRLELNFETAFEVIEALKQAEQAVQRVREVCASDAYEVSNEFGDYDAVAVENILDALDGEQS